MSIKLRKENFMNLSLPYRFQFKKSNNNKLFIGNIC